jgi:hypothetical protein
MNHASPDYDLATLLLFVYNLTATPCRVPDYTWEFLRSMLLTQLDQVKLRSGLEDEAFWALLNVDPATAEGLTEKMEALYD